jgi:hypothetical protein
MSNTSYVYFVQKINLLKKTSKNHLFLFKVKNVFLIADFDWLTIFWLKKNVFFRFIACKTFKLKELFE